MFNREAFLTNNRRDYKWSMGKPLVAISAKPPLRTKPNNTYVARLIEPYCHCDFHLYEPELGRYMKLARKETHLQRELATINNKMGILAAGILDHPCDSDDEKMASLYQLNYINKSAPIARYRKLMAAIDSPFGVPVKGEVLGLGRGYRDPFFFKHSCFPKPKIEPCPCMTYQATPTGVDDWFRFRTGTTEYQDTINHRGLDLIKNRQQYRDPLLTSRFTDDEPSR